MNITELDEFQGLTAEMVREWLLANQWEPCGSSAAHLYYQCGSGEISEALLHEDLGWVVDLLAQSYERSVQSILREINPRMRKGWPSESACAVADRWIAQNTRTKVIIVGSIHYPTGGMELVASLTVRLPQQQSGEWSFWPCDANGNKVRWPTDEEGNML